jgi:hypothetical protein
MLGPAALATEIRESLGEGELCLRVEVDPGHISLALPHRVWNAVRIEDRLIEVQRHGQDATLEIML